MSDRNDLKNSGELNPNSNPGPEVKPQTSKAAITSLILGLGWIFLGPLFPLAGVTGVIFGIVGIVSIRKRRGLLRGQAIAIMGIILSLLPVLLTAVVTHRITTCGKLNSQNPKTILADGRLADLPASVTGVKAEGWSGIFTGEDYLMFKADPKDIDRFIAGSPGLKGQKPSIFSPEKMYLPMDISDQTKSGNSREEEQRHEFFYPHNCPKWYDPTIKVRGRKYEIPPENNHNWGSVIIDDQTNTVYIHVIWS